jgi:hypothetical protein
LRHRYEEVGLPCRNTTGKPPSPTSVYAMYESKISTADMIGRSSPQNYRFIRVGHLHLDRCDTPAARKALRSTTGQCVASGWNTITLGVVVVTATIAASVTPKRS